MKWTPGGRNWKLIDPNSICYTRNAWGKGKYKLDYSLVHFCHDMAVISAKVSKHGQTLAYRPSLGPSFQL
jgi:hypothetical protein